MATGKESAALLSVAARVAAAVLGGRPADRELAECFRGDRTTSQATRGWVADSVMSLWRWWGWVRGESAVSGPPPARGQLASSLLAALLLDGAAPGDRLQTLARAARVGEWPPPPRAGASLAERGAWLGRWWPGARQPGAAAPDPWRLFPEWLPAQLPADEPSAQSRLLETLQTRAPLWIRARARDAGNLAQVLAADGVEVEAHPQLGTAFRYVRGGNLYDTRAFKGGSFEIQDLCSQTVATIAAPRRGERWWDACAGAGGKTLALADLMQGGGTILATDRSKRRLTELARRARRAGVSSVRALSWEGTGAPPVGRRAGFDGVLVDAPCSASGTWRRNPDARWLVGREALARLAASSTDLLEHAARAVRPGGVLVFSTCSLTTIENEEVIERFLLAHPDFAREPFAHPLTGQPTPGQLRLEASDQFFLARFVRGRS